MPAHRKTKPPKSPQPASEGSGDDEGASGIGLWGAEDAEEATEAPGAVKEVVSTAKKGEKKASRRKKRLQQAEQHLSQIRDAALNAPVIVALDMSVGSPGMTIFDRRDPNRTQILIVCFGQTEKQLRQAEALAKPAAVRLLREAPPQKKRRKTAPPSGDAKAQRHEQPEAAEVRIALHRHLPETKDSKESGGEGGGALDNERARRFEHVTETLMDHLKPYCGVPGVLVGVEGYAYHMQSSSVTVLAELGGVMRNKLLRAGLRFAEISPTTVKRWFTGSGAADKREMWARFQKVTDGTLPLDKLIPGSFAKQIPSPHQDIVDSFASAFALHRQLV